MNDDYINHSGRVAGIDDHVSCIMCNKSVELTIRWYEEIHFGSWICDICMREYYPNYKGEVINSLTH